MPTSGQVPAAAAHDAGGLDTSGLDAAGVDAKQGTPPASCRFDEPTSAPRPVLAAVRAREVWFVMSDGSIRPVHTFPAPPATFSQLFWKASVDQRDGAVVVWTSASLRDASGASGQDDHAVLVDLAGNVLWEKTFSASNLTDVTYSREFYALPGDAGFVALMVEPDELLIAPDGGEQPLSQAVDHEIAMAGPFSGPVVPVAYGDFGWWRPGSPPSSTHLVPGPASPGAAFRVGGELVFRATRSDGARVVVHARPDDTETLPVPDAIGQGTGLFTSGLWQGDDLGADVIRFDLMTGASARFPWVLPAGLRRFDPQPTPTMGLDDAGSFLAILRDDATAAIYRSADAASWEQLGKPLTKIGYVGVQNRGGTYLIAADTYRDSTWQAPPPGLDVVSGNSLQIVRPADGIVASINPASRYAVLSSDGTCVAYWSFDTAPLRLTVRDVVRNLEFSTEVPGTAPAGGTIWYSAAWIE